MAIVEEKCIYIQYVKKSDIAKNSVTWLQRDDPGERSVHTTECMSVERAQRRVQMAEYLLTVDKFLEEYMLYDIVWFSVDHPELKLRSNAHSWLAGKITVRRFWRVVGR